MFRSANCLAPLLTAAILIAGWEAADAGLLKGHPYVDPFFPSPVAVVVTTGVPTAVYCTCTPTGATDSAAVCPKCGGKSAGDGKCPDGSVKTILALRVPPSAVVWINHEKTRPQHLAGKHLGWRYFDLVGLKPGDSSVYLIKAEWPCCPHGHSPLTVEREEVIHAGQTKRLDLIALRPPKSPPKQHHPHHVTPAQCKCGKCEKCRAAAHHGQKPHAEHGKCEKCNHAPCHCAKPGPLKSACPKCAEIAAKMKELCLAAEAAKKAQQTAQAMLAQAKAESDRVAKAKKSFEATVKHYADLKAKLAAADQVQAEARKAIQARLADLKAEIAAAAQAKTDRRELFRAEQETFDARVAEAIGQMEATAEAKRVKDRAAEIRHREAVKQQIADLRKAGRGAEADDLATDEIARQKGFEATAARLKAEAEQAKLTKQSEFAAARRKAEDEEAKRRRDYEQKIAHLRAHVDEANREVEEKAREAKARVLAN